LAFLVALITRALGAFASTIGSALIYYGLTGNPTASNRYWINVSCIIGLLILAATIWFLSQGNARNSPLTNGFPSCFVGCQDGYYIANARLGIRNIGNCAAADRPSYFLRLKWLRLLYLVAGLFFLFCLVLSDSGTGGWLLFSALHLSFSLAVMDDCRHGSCGGINNCFYF